jgi:hypothetical protein
MFEGTHYSDAVQQIIVSVVKVPLSETFRLDHSCMFGRLRDETELRGAMCSSGMW